MEPLTVFGLVAAAGFVFNKLSSKGDSESNKSDIASTKVLNTKGHTELAISSIRVLPEYKLIRDLIIGKIPVVFVTGGAGTGKTTFIQWISSEFKGGVLLAAPTGMTALNIEGKTLHSLFQLPIGIVRKGDIKENPRRLDVLNAKLLIIDEISMVSANVLDGVNAYLKKNRGSSEPFGGVPVVMVGDLFQLPPVSPKVAEREFLKKYYRSHMFFDSIVLSSERQSPMFYGVELQTTFRQVEQDYVDALANIREGVNLAEAVSFINSKCKITKSPQVGSVWLAPRNSEVDNYNRRELEALPTELKRFRATMSGTFENQGKHYPTLPTLELKVGAQVMFVQNDPKKRWVNGTIGEVIAIEYEHIFVQIEGTDKQENVGIAIWEDYQYVWNRKTQALDKKVVGTFEQYPLALAWAMTIHKSQGKTIEKLHVDFGQGIFETGQTYVALSRCKTIGGLSLSRPLHVSDIQVDEKVREFYIKLREIVSALPPQKLMAEISAQHSRSRYCRKK